MTTETYAYMRDPMLTDIFETPDNSYIVRGIMKDANSALTCWLADLIVPCGMGCLELNVAPADNWVTKDGNACKATLRWSSEYPDLPLYLYVEYLTTTCEGESIYQVTVQPLDD